MATRCMAKVVWKVIGLNPGLLSGQSSVAWRAARHTLSKVCKIGIHKHTANIYSQFIVGNAIQSKAVVSTVTLQPMAVHKTVIAGRQL